MGLLSKLAEAFGWKREEVKELTFLWNTFPDPQRPGHDVLECMLPGGSYFLVQEVSAPDPERGHWGWILMDRDNQPVEMRNGFFEADAAKAHAINHFNAAYVI